VIEVSGIRELTSQVSTGKNIGFLRPGCQLGLSALTLFIVFLSLAERVLRTLRYEKSYPRSSLYNFSFLLGLLEETIKRFWFSMAFTACHKTLFVFH
jgi:hypothetical protein